MAVGLGVNQITQTDGALRQPGTDPHSNARFHVTTSKIFSMICKFIVSKVYRKIDFDGDLLQSLLPAVHRLQPMSFSFYYSRG